MAETYTTLSPADLLLVARDTLRGRETDHFRVSLLNEPGKENRLAAMSDEIENLKQVVADLEAEIEADAPEPEVEADPED